GQQRGLLHLGVCGVGVLERLVLDALLDVDDLIALGHGVVPPLRTGRTYRRCTGVVAPISAAGGRSPAATDRMGTFPLLTSSPSWQHEGLHLRTGRSQCG